MTTAASGDGWGEWSRFVLKELERLNENIEGLRREMTQVHTEVATLKTKAGMWGAVGAAIPVLVMLLWQLLK